MTILLIVGTPRGKKLTEKKKLAKKETKKKKLAALF
jgi:hypothetical protein